MRILAIRGRNLASLEGTFAVELEQPPLERVGLFAITGPTGAGKSTLLDALCLALFDNMPRLPGGQGVIVGRAGEPEGLRIRSNDVRSILRRGAVEGHAEVDFIGNDRHRYRARWDVRRARNKADGRLQEQNLSLISLGTGQTLGRTKKETLALIVERLGLDFDQFRRSVLLAQGDFAAFLKADAKLRSELLERITGTEIYGELSKAAHRRAAEERKRLDELEKQLGAGKPLDAAVRQELEQRCAQEQQKHAQAEQARQTAQRVIDWHNRLMELEKLERAAAADLAIAQQALQAAAPRRQEFQAVQQAQAWRSLVADHDRAVQEYEAARQALEQAIRAGKQAREKLQEAQQDRQGKETALQQASAQREAAWPALQQARILNQQLVEACSQYDKARQESTTAAAQLKQAEQQRHKLAAEYQDLQEQRDRAVDWLAGNAHLSDLARQWERWDSEFRRYLQTAGEAESVRRKLQQLDKETANLNKRLVQADEQLTVARQAVEMARNQLQTLESAAQLTSLDELRQQRIGLEERRDRLRNWHTLVQEAGVKNNARGQAQTALQEIRRQADNAGREMTEQFKLLEQQRVALGEAERALQLARLAHKEDVKSLRAALQDGEPCPVCGAVEHPWAQAAATPLAHWFAEQQQRVDELKRRERELTAAHSRLEASRDHSRQQALEWEARLQTLTIELTTLHQRWAARPPVEALADELLAAGLEQEIAGRLAAAETALAKVRESERQALSVQQQIDKVRKELDKRREQNDRLQQTCDGWQQSIQQLGAERTTQKTMLERAGQNLQALQEQLAGPLTGMANWRQALTTDASGLHAHCQGQALA
jgi:exonuclease SbcC